MLRPGMHVNLARSHRPRLAVNVSQLLLLFAVAVFYTKKCDLISLFLYLRNRGLLFSCMGLNCNYELHVLDLSFSDLLLALFLAKVPFLRF